MLVYFIIQTLMSLKKIKSLSAFVRTYIRFFSKPMLFMFLYTAFTRGLVCFCRGFRVTEFYRCCSLLFLLPLTGLVENEKRLKDLSIYFSVEALQAFVASFKSYFGITDPKFDIRLNVR
jgi:hypothetical protein